MQELHATNVPRAGTLLNAETLLTEKVVSSFLAETASKYVGFAMTWRAEDFWAL